MKGPRFPSGRAHRSTVLQYGDCTSTHLKRAPSKLRCSSRHFQQFQPYFISIISVLDTVFRHKFTSTPTSFVFGSQLKIFPSLVSLKTSLSLNQPFEVLWFWQSSYSIFKTKLCQLNILCIAMPGPSVQTIAFKIISQSSLVKCLSGPGLGMKSKSKASDSDRFL